MAPIDDYDLIDWGEPAPADRRFVKRLAWGLAAIGIVAVAAGFWVAG